MYSKKIGFIIAALVAAQWCCGIVQAQEGWPSGKPIRLVVGFAPGGPADLVARVLAKQLSGQLQSPVLVENHAGANANIAANLVAKSAPDGYTFLFNTSSLAISPALYRNLPFDPAKDLIPVASAAVLPLVLVVEASSPVNTFKEWVAYLKANPAKYNYGSPGAGNLAHLGMVMLLQANGLEATHVPYKGSSEALAALLGKNTQFQLDSVNSVLALIRAGRVKPIAVVSLNRAPILPEVPTVSESGMPEFELTAWQGVMAPAKTPIAIVERFNAEIAKAMDQPEMKTTLAAQGAVFIARSPGQYANYFQSEVQRYQKVVKVVGLTQE